LRGVRHRPAGGGRARTRSQASFRLAGGGHAGIELGALAAGAIAAAASYSAAFAVLALAAGLVGGRWALGGRRPPPAAPVECG
jgi:hypothetical protein